MTISQRFGRLMTSDAVASGVQSHLQEWLVPFLAEVERQLGLAARSIAQPASWEIVSSFNKFDGSRLPSVVIAVDEIKGEPMRNGDASYDAIYPVAVAVVVGGRTPQETERNAMAYGAAVRGAMLYIFDHQQDLGAVGVKWAGETYTEVDATDRRTKGAAMILFDVRVENVARDYRGAVLGIVPPVEPYAAPEDWHTADTVATDLEKVSP